MDEVTCKVVRTKAGWAALVEACEKSGQPAAVFCRGKGIAYSLFLYHRSKIIKKSGKYLSEERSPRLAASRGTMSMPVAARQSTFIPVHVSEGLNVRLKFPRGLVLESSELPSATWLIEVALRWNDAEVSPC